MRRLLLSLVALLCTFVSIFAQETTSELQGVVTGENSKGLQGATITATHLPTGTKYTTTARADGQYNLPNVRVGGPYEVTASYVGYQAATQRDITLALGTAFKADFQLVSSAGNLAEVVVSTTRSDRVFSRSRTGAAEVINRQQIERLPTVSRSLQDFTRLTPSANGLSFGGRSSAGNNLTVNGASFNNTFGLSGTLGGQTNSQPISLDALEQVQVNIAPYDVTLGSFTGAGINSVTRSGTNSYRGAVYYYKRNPSLTGTKVATVTLPQQQFDYYNLGANLGGYIIKNKLFFFVNYERERLAQPATSFTASRNGKPAVPGAISQANGDSLDALRSFLVTKYGYDPGPYENYNYKTNADRITARIDYNISSKNTFTLNYFYLKSNRNVAPSNSGAIAGNRQPSNTAMPFLASSYIINNNFNIFIAELNTRFSNTLSNKLQIGYNRLRDFRSSPGGIFPLVDIANGQGSTYTAFGYEPFTANNVLNTDTYQFNDIVSLFQGKHSFTFGTQNTYNKFINGFAPNYYGAYQFPSLSAFYDAANNGALTASRYELRYSARKSGEFPFAEIKALQLGFFAQDRWNATSNFVLTAGLRADLPIFGNSFGDNPDADALVYRNGVRINTGRKPKTSVLWSPRLGFNWDAKSDRTVQVRGGLGVFAGAPPFVWVSNQASNNGVDFGSFVKSNVGFSADVNANRPSDATANTSYNLAVTDEDFKFPQLFRANLAVDKRIFGGITATVEGIYSKDINAVYHQNVNLPNTGAPLVGADNRIRYTSTQIYSGAGGATAANPNISDAILMSNTSKGYTYNITGQLQRNVNNLYTMVAYTYGKSKSVNDGGSIAQSIWRDRPVMGDPNSTELGYSNYYLPHRVVAAAYYRVEYLKKSLASSIGLTFEAASGGNGSYIYSGDLNNDALVNDLIYIPRSQDEIVLVPEGATDTRTPAVIWSQLNTYINQDPYLYKRRGQYAERNGLQLPFYKRLDLNFTQDIIVRTGKRSNTLRFTADIYNFGNLLNRNWGLFRTTVRTLSTQNNSIALLNFKGVVTSGPDAGKPSFSFPYQNATNQVPLVSTFENSTSQASRYQIQLGLRYIFQ